MDASRTKSGRGSVIVVIGVTLTALMKAPSLMFQAVYVEALYAQKQRSRCGEINVG
jgi:hypothetical protein